MSGIGVSNLAIEANSLAQVQGCPKKRKINPIVFGVAPAVAIPAAIMANRKDRDCSNMDTIDYFVDHQKNNFKHGLAATGILGSIFGWTKLVEKHPDKAKVVTDALKNAKDFISGKIKKFIKPELLEKFKKQFAGLKDDLTKLVKTAPKPVKIVAGALLALVGLSYIYNSGKIDQKHTPPKPVIFY